MMYNKSNGYTLVELIVTIVFEQFIKDNFKLVCPAEGTITYEDGHVKCSVHGDGSEEDDEPSGEEVPWL